MQLPTIYNVTYSNHSSNLCFANIVFCARVHYIEITSIRCIMSLYKHPSCVHILYPCTRLTWTYVLGNIIKKTLQ